MIYYSKNGLNEEIDLTKSKNSKECIVCHYWHLNHGLKFQNLVSNIYHDLLIMSLEINNIAIILMKVVNYQCIIYDISKSDRIHSLKNPTLMIMDLYKTDFQETNIINQLYYFRHMTR